MPKKVKQNIKRKKSGLVTANMNKYILSVSGILMVVSLTVYNFGLFINNHNSPTVNQSAEVNNILVLEKGHWLKLLEDNPSYTHGWLRLTEIEFELDDSKAAFDAFFTAKSTNPNSDLYGVYEHLLSTM